MPTLKHRNAKGKAQKRRLKVGRSSTSSNSSLSGSSPSISSPSLSPSPPSLSLSLSLSPSSPSSQSELLSISPSTSPILTETFAQSFDFQQKNAIEIDFTSPRFRIGTPITLSPENANQLPFLCQTALEFLKQQDLELQEGYRIVFSPISQTLWQLYVDIDQFLWYHLLKKKLEEEKNPTYTIDQLINHYLTRMEKLSHQETHLLEIQNEIPYYPERGICDYNDNHVRCPTLKKKGQCCNEYKKENLCGCIKNCGLSFHRQLHLSYLSGKGYCVHVRLEPSRNLLLFSRKHYHPKKLILKIKYWEKIISTILSIYDEFPLLDCPITSVSLNIGTWSTQTRHSKRVSNDKIHALTHITFTPEAILWSKKSKMLYLLKGRLEDPEVDRFDYADELKKKKKIEELVHKQLSP